MEYAKSGRASCKVCKGKIEKDALRVGTKVVVDHEKLAADENAAQNAHILESVKWHHIECFSKMRQPRWFKAHLPEASTCSGFEALREEDQKKVTAIFALCKGEDAELPQISPEKAAPGAGKGRKRKAAADTPEELTPAQKLAKLTGQQDVRGAFTEEQFAAFQRERSELAKKSNAQLQAMLARNGLPKTGKKDELVERVAECKVLGVSPICSVCTKGRLKWNRASGNYTCPGFFDEEAKRMTRCKGPEKDAAVERVAWQEAVL